MRRRPRDEVTREALRALVAEKMDRARLSGTKVSPVKPGQSFIAWVEELAANGLKVDGQPFSFDGRDSLRFLYELIPTTPEEARGKMIVVMKGAQVGMTVWEMLVNIYMLLAWGRCWVGSFVPDRTLAGIKSSLRFMPLLKTIPAAYERLVTETGAGEKKRGEGNVLTRKLGDNVLFFLWTSGKVSTESNPMDAVTFDEVQEMEIGDLETTFERLSGSAIGFILLLSTAKWPDGDIDYFYQRGARWRFHHRCGCATGCVLDDHIHVDRIDCIAFDDATGDYQYQCPVCETFIYDNQVGDWRDRSGRVWPTTEKDPDGLYDSVHFPQTLSAVVTPRKMLESFRSSKDKQNWFNRKAGKPFSDPDQIPINDEVLRICVADGAAAGVTWKTSSQGSYMGIDQMGAYNVVIIRERLADGRSAVVHVEEIRDSDPFARCDELMRLFRVHVCVLEHLPNYNDAHRFAKRHQGKVFLCDKYGQLQDDMMVWGDEPRMNPSDRRTDNDARSRYTVHLDQYRMMQAAMRRMVDRALLFPDPDALIAETKTDSGPALVPVLRDVVFHHFKHVALIVEDDPDVGKKRRKVLKIRIDPHFAYANMLCEVAWSRAHGTSTFYTPEAPAMAKAGEQTIVDVVPEPLRQVLTAMPAEGCGACEAFESGVCRERGFKVKETDPSCPLFVAVS